MATKASVAEIEAHFSDFVRAAESGDTVLVTRHGKPVVALVPVSEVAQLERLRAAGPDLVTGNLRHFERIPGEGECMVGEDW